MPDTKWTLAKSPAGRRCSRTRGTRCSPRCERSSSARTTSSWASSPAYSAAGTASSSASPASPRRSWSARSRRYSTCPSSACSSPPTSCPPTSPAPTSSRTRAASARSASSPARSSPISSSPTRSTARRPKTQAALLEAMQERQVTVGKETYRLPDPFFVVATQNPIEQEGTYPLPEAQLDRFMFNLFVDYPDLAEEERILGLSTGQTAGASRQGPRRRGHQAHPGGGRRHRR